MLDRARRDARRIYVGKARGDHSVPQDQIEPLMNEEARAGHRVVRLRHCAGPPARLTVQRTLRPPPILPPK